MPELDCMIGGGLITLERAYVLLYRPANVLENERARGRTEGLSRATFARKVPSTRAS